MMNITIQCDDVSVKYGEATLRGVTAMELIMSMSNLDTQELIQAIEACKGKEYILDVINEGD